MLDALHYYERAYAKVNLHLEVLNKRPDGYHNIFSIMSAVGIYDLLKLYECELVCDSALSPKVCLVDDGGAYASVIRDLPVEKNLVYKAIVSYCRRTNFSGSFTVGIEKNIPAGGGLGGGSSDAAAMLRLLNRKYSLLSHQELLICAAEVGADVPFCIAGGTAVCTGIGDRIKSISPFDGYSILIVNNGVHVDTAKTYSLIDSYRERKGKRKSEGNHVISEFLNSDVDNYNGIIKYFHNDFEEAVFQDNPSIKELKHEMMDAGADISLMTGSGSTVFGLFKQLDVAERARKRFEHKKVRAYISNFVSSENH